MSSSERRRILVTGSSGFIGGWTAGILAERGYTVRAQYRRSRIPAHLEEVRRLGAELLRGDLTVADDISTLLEGVETVIHCAAMARDWGYEEDFRLQSRLYDPGSLEVPARPVQDVTDGPLGSQCRPPHP